MSLLDEENEIVDDLAIMMRGKLRANCHKSSWRTTTDLKFLLSRLKEETKELEEELDRDTHRPGKIRMECADIGNIVAMIADLARF